MTASRKITIAVAGTVTAVLAAGGIAMATPAATDLPSPATSNPATAMMYGQFEPVAGGDGPQADWMNEMHAGDVDWMDQMPDDGWMDGDMGAMHSQMGAMHGGAGQMAQHHAQMTERDPQMQQRHDEMADRYPEMREHMGAAAPLRDRGRS